MDKPTFGSLFAGIGGIDLGLERAGMVCRWQVEIDPFCCSVLEKHWPNAKRYGDITKLGGSELEWVNGIAAGFPCQDVSTAGLRKGVGGGTRSGLYADTIRLVSYLRPDWLLLENVPGLLSPVRTGDPAPISRVLGDLAEIRYDAEWDCLPASAFGAYHERDRVVIVAYPESLNGSARRVLEAGGIGRALLQSRRLHSMAMATRGKQENSRLASEPGLDRLVPGVPDRTHRLKACGNSVYPAVAEWIGRRIYGN